MIVQHAPVLLLLWDGHVNTEWGASWSLPVYLYKYFYKGTDRTRFRIAPATEALPAEVRHILRLFICELTVRHSI
jgi:hypothetical protein